MNSKDLASKCLSKAMECMSTNKGKAFAHFIIALKLCPEWKSEHSTFFLELTENVTTQLMVRGKMDDFFNCYEHALLLYPNSAELNYFFANKLLKLDCTYKAFIYLRKVAILEPENPLYQREVDDLKNSLVERWHYRMLNDQRRNDAYRKSIKTLLKDSDTVLDIGCGSGLLTLYASEVKPSKLVAVEVSEALYNVARDVFIDNQLEGVQLINKLSTQLNHLDIGGKISTVVTEIFDAGLFGEGILQTMIHARKKLMQNLESDIVIPYSADLYVCGIQSQRLAKKHVYVGDKLKGNANLNEITIHKHSSEPYDTEDLSQIDDIKYMTDVIKILSVNFLDTISLEDMYEGRRKIENINLTANSNGKINALAVWFELHLCEGISITTDPKNVDRSKAWEQAIFHLLSPYVCQKGDEYPINLQCKKGKLLLLTRNLDTLNDFSVCSDVIRLLNDGNFTNYADSTAGAICVHIAQNYLPNSVHILDLSMFPLIGLFALSRGIQNLTCMPSSYSEKQLILRVCENNGINKNRINFIDSYDDVIKANPFKYHVIINNFYIQSFGELNARRIQSSWQFRFRNILPNGLVLPYKIIMLGQVIYSEELERLNRLNDENVSNYKIAQSINVYQTGQFFVSDISTFPYKPMSEQIVIYEQCLHPWSNRVLDFEMTTEGSINGVLCWFEIQLLEKGDVYSTKNIDSFMACTIHLLESGLVTKASKLGSLLVCCDDSGYLKIAVDLND